MEIRLRQAWHDSSHREISQRAQRTKVRISHDDMIRDFNFHQLAGPDQIAGHFDVRHARRRVAARVIMYQHNERRFHRHRHREYLSRMD